MRILFLHMTMGLVDRGAERVVDLLATGLSKNNQAFVLQSGKALKNKKYKSLQVYKLNQAPPVAPRNIWEKILFRLYLDLSSRQVVQFTIASSPHIDKFDPDIIIVMNGAEQLKIIKHNFPSVKTVVFGEAGIGYHDRNTLRSAPHLFVALTQYAASWADKYRRSRTKIAVVPNPLVVASKRTTSLTTLKLPRPIILTVGALSDYKNIKDVIVAVSGLAASLVVIGDGEQREEVAKLLSKFPGDFQWIKHVEPSEMMSYYQSADVFCFVPDPQEAFGNVYIEAMSAGLPIVASNDLIRREIVGEKGIYVKAHDLNDIRVGIEKAINIGRQNYEKESSKYRLPVIIKKLEKEFHAIIK